jgi:hypothetical protein
MENHEQNSLKNLQRRTRTGSLARPLAMSAGVLLALPAANLLGAENTPRRPFAEWAEVPQAGQFVVGAWYQESEAYHIWAGNQRSDITVRKDGESYGIDRNQGIISVQYGITDRWAADLNVGPTTLGWRSFSPNNSIESTTGLMDSSFGVRYQIFQDGQGDNPWLPTLTFRAGAVLPGSYSKSLAFTPGNRSAAIEPSLLARKLVGWPGFGVYGDVAYRWERTVGTDQYLASVGIFQQIKQWELDLGYRHLQTLSGEDITLNPFSYPRDVREISDALEAGFSYTTSKRHIKYTFHTRKIFDGSNTESAFWVGGYIDFPIGGKPKPAK